MFNQNGGSKVVRVLDGSKDRTRGRIEGFSSLDSVTKLLAL